MVQCDAANRDETKTIDFPDDLTAGRRAGKLPDQPIFKRNGMQHLDGVGQEDTVQLVTEGL